MDGGGTRCPEGVSYVILYNNKCSKLRESKILFSTHKKFAGELFARLKENGTGLLFIGSQFVVLDAGIVLYCDVG